MISIAIQAGGSSSRMGMDKGQMLFNGQPLALRLLQRFSTISDDVFLISNDPEGYARLQIPICADKQPGQGALGGLYTALYYAKQPLVGVIACDMPFANVDLLQRMGQIALDEQADVVIPRANGQYEPFHAVYRLQPCLAFIDAALAAGEKRMISWFGRAVVREVSPEEIRQFDPYGICFTNVNTQAEFGIAERLEQSLLKQGGKPL